MKRVPLSTTGVRVSQMCLGTMMLGDRADERESARIVDAALERGVDFIDTATVYAEGRTEEILGRILKGRRERAFLVTKVWGKTGAEYPELIPRSLDESLKRLQTDRVDLLLIHWPRKGMDMAAIMAALAGAVRAGKTRFVGCSNFPAWLVSHANAVAQQVGAPRLVNNQVPYNIVERGVEVEVLPQAVAERVAITCYRPLLAGVLSGKYNPDQPAPADARGVSDERIPRWVAAHANGLRRLFALAKERGVPPAQVAIAWVKDQPGVTAPLIGVSRLAQFEEAVGAFDLELSSEDRAGLAAAFDSAVKEVSGGNFGPLRREFGLVAEASS